MDRFQYFIWIISDIYDDTKIPERCLIECNEQVEFLLLGYNNEQPKIKTETRSLHSLNEYFSSLLLLRIRPGKMIKSLQKVLSRDRSLFCVDDK